MAPAKCTLRLLATLINSQPPKLLSRRRKMAETKYGKYFVKIDPTKWTGRIPAIIHLEDKIIKGSNFYFVHWNLPGQKPPEGPGAEIGHPPHTHPYNEILMHIGTDPNNPMDLGAEVEFCMGPEMEKHLITQTCAVFIPANFIHAPYRVLKTVRPWITVMIVEGPTRTEEPHPEILPEELRKKIDWSRWERLRTGFPTP